MYSFLVYWSMSVMSDIQTCPVDIHWYLWKTKNKTLLYVRIKCGWTNCVDISLVLQLKKHVKATDNFFGKWDIFTNILPIINTPTRIRAYDSDTIWAINVLQYTIYMKSHSQEWLEKSFVSLKYITAALWVNFFHEHPWFYLIAIMKDMVGSLFH